MNSGGSNGSVEVRPAGSKGLGAFASRDFAEGETVFQYPSGRLVHIDDVSGLHPWDYEHLRELTAETYEVLTAPRCYLNHSCNPNVIDLERRVRAIRPIESGDELTLDYRMNAHDDGDVWEMVCDCGGEPGPHLVRGDFFSLPDETQRRYLEWAPEFIRESYARRHTS
ncbi:MAG: SET domain-containing protein [Dehalococcoidia bacterium]